MDAEGERVGLGTQLLIAVAGLAVCVAVTFVVMVICYWKDSWGAVRKAFQRLIEAWRKSKRWQLCKEYFNTLRGHVVLFMVGTFLIGMLLVGALRLIVGAPISGEESAAEQLNSIVTSAVTILGLATAGGAAAVGYRRQRSHEVTARAERLQKAIEHLGSERIETQKGALYELKSLALDSKNDTVDVMDILRYFVLEKCSIIPRTQPVAGRFNKLPYEVKLAFEQMTEIVRKRGLNKQIDLSSIVLVGMNLQLMNFCWADFRRATLDGVLFIGAILTGANLRFTYLIGADLRFTDLRSADLQGAHLNNAKFNERTDFTDAIVNEHTDFTGVKNLRQAKGLPDWVLDKFDPIPKNLEPPAPEKTA
ncbi:MAG: pentapeptide repeat-containing protein [Oscillospiraceae bacterium]|jgi:hypothetical protein|nr:pentapeptide repeat-containing protein [Oscillospiraceae bacterium]